MREPVKVIFPTILISEYALLESAEDNAENVLTLIDAPSTSLSPPAENLSLELFSNFNLSSRLDDNLSLT